MYPTQGVALGYYISRLWRWVKQKCESGDASLIAAFLAQPLRRAAGRHSAFTVMARHSSLFRHSVK